MKEATQMEPATDASSARHLAKTFWDAMGRRDINTVLGLFADDIVYEVMGIGHLLPHGDIYYGKESVARDLFQIFSNYNVETIELTVNAIYVDGTVAVVEFSVDAIAANGRPYVDARYVSILKFENGKIISVREYPDSLKVKTCLLD